MTSNFSINRVFEENLEVNFTIDNGSFNTNGQVFILQHSPAIQVLSTLTSWSHEVLNVNTANYFIIDYRWSFDTITWTNWITMPANFNNFLNPNTAPNIWFQIRYTYVQGTPSYVIKLKELTIKGTRKIPEIFQPIDIQDTPAVYKNQDTYKIFSLTDFKVYMNQGSINDLEINFRFTQTQGRLWTPWVPLTTENLVATKFERLKFANFEFSFRNLGSNPLSIFDLELIGEFQNITANYKTLAKFGLKTQCNPIAVQPPPTGPCIEDCGPGSGSTGCCDDCYAGSDAITPWNPDIDSCAVCNGAEYTNLNDKKLFTSQIDLYNELNKFIQGINSWKVTYFLTDPDGKGIDHVLHEQQLHNIVKFKDLQIIVPDNQFPVDIINMSGLDFDLLQTFEIQILKDSFKSTFGVEFRPGKKDVIYFCDLNQLWEVEQMFPHRGFMLAEVYYRVVLKKYNDRKSRQYANTQDGQDAKSMIDSLTKYTTLDSLFGIDVKGQLKQNTKDLNVKVDNPSQQHTQLTQIDIRKAMVKASIKIENIDNASLTVAKSMYEIDIKTKNIKTIEYVPTDKQVGLGDNRAISFWFKTSDYDPNWDYTLLSNYNTTSNLGYKVNLFQGNLEFRFNNNTYMMPMPGFAVDVWYAFLINVDQRQQKLELSIYNRQSENGLSLSSSQLVLFNKLIIDITPDQFTHAETIFIGGIDTFSSLGNRKKWYMTNIRIYNQVIDKTQRQIVLNENTVSDANLTLLVDNAEKKLILPQYGNP